MDTSHPSEIPTPPTPPPASESPVSGDRREFLKSAACLALGGACLLAPVAAGVTVLLGPLRTAPPDGSWVNLTKLDALPIGAAPRLFQVFIERTDAWTRHARSAVGAVFLERLDETTVRAFQSACPHLGCAVEWRKEGKQFFCPCHNSAFERAGGIIGPSPAARGLDTLTVEIREGGEVWVKFQTFKAGVKEKFDWLDARTGYRWLARQALYEHVPGHTRFYGKKNDRMPAFGQTSRLSTRDLDLLIRWLRGEPSAN